MTFLQHRRIVCARVVVTLLMCLSGALVLRANRTFADEREASPVEPAGVVGPPLLSGSAREQAIENALDGPNCLGPYKETPLADVVQNIKELCDIECTIDARALEAVGSSPEGVLVTTPRSDCSLRSFLSLVLQQLDLTFVVKMDHLIVTTREQAQSDMPIWIYDVTDLARRSQSQGEADEELINMLLLIVVEAVAPDAWEQNGTGDGKIHSYTLRDRTFLVVRQTESIQLEIEPFLNRLRLAVGLPAAAKHRRVVDAALEPPRTARDAPAAAPRQE